MSTTVTYKNYRIVINESEFMLQHEVKAGKMDKDRKPTGETYLTWKPLGYFSSMERAIQRIARTETEKGNPTLSLDDYIRRYMLAIDKVKAMVL